MKLVRVYLGNELFGTLLVDDGYDPRRLRTYVIKTIVSKLMPDNIPITARHRSRKVRREIEKAVRSSLRLVVTPYTPPR